MDSLKCHICGSSELGHDKMSMHMRFAHGFDKPRTCNYCKKVFSDIATYQRHMQSVHGLPISSDIETSTQPTTSAFNGDLEKYEIDFESHSNLDLLSTMEAYREKLTDLVDTRCSYRPRIIQFSAKVNFWKLIDALDDFERTSAYINSAIKNVFFAGLDDNTYSQMVDYMMSSLTAFAIQGSGCIVEKISKLIIKFAKSIPVRGSGFIELPAIFAKNKNLLNIRNHEDFNCFLNCYTAAYHDTFGP